MKPILTNQDIKAIAWDNDKLYITMHFPEETIEVHGYTIHTPARDHTFCYTNISYKKYLEIIKEREL